MDAAIDGEKVAERAVIHTRTGDRHAVTVVEIDLVAFDDPRQRNPLDQQVQGIGAHLAEAPNNIRIGSFRRQHRGYSHTSSALRQHGHRPVLWLADARESLDDNHAAPQHRAQYSPRSRWVRTSRGLGRRCVIASLDPTYALRAWMRNTAWPRLEDNAPRRLPRLGKSPPIRAMRYFSHSGPQRSWSQTRCDRSAGGSRARHATGRTVAAGAMVIGSVKQLPARRWGVRAGKPGRHTNERSVGKTPRSFLVTDTRSEQVPGHWRFHHWMTATRRHAGSMPPA